jgi:uncharacterized protein (TIGR02996 family)
MVSDEQRALWAAIRANPDDDTPRLVYADWLQENGEEDRAEFIRVQCALAAGSHSANAQQALEAEEKQLLALHREKWLAPFVKLFGSDRRWHPTDHWFAFCGFRRGLVCRHALDLDPLKLLAASRDWLEPIEIERAVFGPSEFYRTVLKSVCRWCGASTFTAFSVGGAGDSDINAVIASKKLRRLSTLRLWIGRVSNAGVKALAEWPHAAGLRELDLNINPISDTGAYALADSPYLTNITRLDLTETRIGPKGKKRLRERFGEKVVLDP